MIKSIRSILFLILFLFLLPFDSFGQNHLDLNVFPNPTYDVATIEISHADIQASDVVISNIIGKELYKKKLIGLGRNSKFEIDMSFLSPGIYILHIMSGEEVLATKKVVRKG